MHPTVGLCLERVGMYLLCFFYPNFLKIPEFERLDFAIEVMKE